MDENNKRALKDILLEDVICQRRSIRKFTQEPVTEEDLRYIFEAGRWAPSGENSQGWRLLVVKDKEKIARLGEISGLGSGRRFTGEFATKRMQARFEGLKDEEKKKAAFRKLMSGDVSRFVGTAPVVLVVVGKKDVWDVQIDNAACIENMLLMIAALGLGATWVIAPCTDIRDEQDVNELLGIPKSYKAISVIPIGHMERMPHPRPRLELKDITWLDEFGVPYYQE